MSMLYTEVFIKSSMYIIKLTVASCQVHNLPDSCCNFTEKARTNSFYTMHSELQGQLYITRIPSGGQQFLSLCIIVILCIILYFL